MKYPPFCDIINLEVSDYDEHTAHLIVNAIYDNLLKLSGKDMQIYSPMPPPINKVKKRYRWRIIIKCKLNSQVINKINLCINSIKIASNTRISIDINPNNMS